MMHRLRERPGNGTLFCLVEVLGAKQAADSFYSQWLLSRLLNFK